MPHLTAAFNYARWLTRSEADAEDVVQEACVRAIRFLSSLRDGDARPWLLAIVRNTWYSHVSRTKPGTLMTLDDDGAGRQDEAPNPEQILVSQDDTARVRAALERLPADLREVIVLRDLEGLSYKEIAGAVRVPIGTVMSRISRGRDRLASLLRADAGAEVLR